jgi:exopolysaccharide biosynthesis WecB/TagA/CpsF family protein
MKLGGFRIRRGIIDGSGVKISPRFWGTARLRGVDVVGHVLADDNRSRILVWGMSTATYQSYGCPWKHVSGYSHEISTHNAIAEIVGYQPDVVFVCQNSPEQETLGESLSSLLPSALVILAGGSFDALYGKKKLFPKLIHSLGIEWLATALCDPKRFVRLPQLMAGTIKGFKVFQ